MLTVVLVAPNTYLAVLRDAAGALVCRLTGPPDWILEQLATAMDAKKAAAPKDDGQTVPR